MLKRFTLIFLLLAVMVALVGEEETEESYKEKYEELKKSTLEISENEKYMKNAPEGLEINNYVIDDKGYFWYIYKNEFNEYQVMRSNGYQDIIIETIVNKQDNFNNTPFSYRKTHKLTNGTIVFLTSKDIIIKRDNNINVHTIAESDHILKVFKQNQKLIVISELGYYIVKQDGIDYFSVVLPIENMLSTSVYSKDDALSQHVKEYHQKSLTKNNNILYLMVKYNLAQNYYRYNSNGNFNYMKQLISINQDFYLQTYNEVFNDSIFIMGAEEYNNLINPMVVPELFSDSGDNSYCYFKYSNYLYDINSLHKKAERISISSEIKIVDIFLDKKDKEWVIYHDDEKLYITDFESFVKNEPEHHYYTFTEQESASGGSFCLYLEEDIYKFITKGTLNNTKFTDADKPIDSKDISKVYQLDYIRYLQMNDKDDTDQLVEFNPKFDCSKFWLIRYSDNMMIYQEHAFFSDIKEVFFYDFKNAKSITKNIQISGLLNHIIYNRTKNLLVFFSETSRFMQFHTQWEKQDVLLNSIDIEYFNDDTMITGSYEIFSNISIFKYDNDTFIFRDSLANSQITYIDDKNKELYFSEKKDGEFLLKKYQIESSKIDSLISYQREAKIIFSKVDTKILLVNKDSYQLIDMEFGYPKTILDIESSELFSLITDIDAQFLKIFAENLYIESSKILYDLAQNEYQEKDNWVNIAFTDSLAYLLYEEFINDNFIYRVSNLINYNPLKQKEDFVYSSKYEIDNIYLLSSGNKYFPIFNNKLYYKSRGQWNEFFFKQNLFPVNYSGVEEVDYRQTIPTISLNSNSQNLVMYNNKSFSIIDNVHNISVIDYATNLSLCYYGKHGLPTIMLDFFITTNNELYLYGLNLNLHSARFTLYKLNKSLLNPTLDISWLEVNGERKDLSKPLKFASTENNITIPVAILNYMYPEDYPMKYKLTGFDKEWKVGTYDGKIAYENLNPGKYAFDVQAFPTDFSDMSWPTIEFRILPPWYRAWWAYCAYALFLGLVIYLIFKQRVKQYKKNQEFLENKVTERTHELSETNNTLKIKTTELTEKTLELTEQQKKMRESIEYASLIQRSILPQATELKSLFNDYFVIWKPRDIVGGDFYWLYDNPDQHQAYLSVIDCTGHGVPGALLSMTVNSLLNHTIKDKHIISPAEIIQELHQEICSLMHQKAERSVQDGFEIALVKFDFASKTITYSGAGLNILIQEPNKELHILKGDRYNVGGQKLYANINFTEKSYTYLANTKIYLYSDGIIDQPIPNSERVKRLGYKGWIETINSLQGLPMTEQSDKLNGLIEAMLKEHEQRDDITIMGVEIL